MMRESKLLAWIPKRKASRIFLSFCSIMVILLSVKSCFKNDSMIGQAEDLINAINSGDNDTIYASLDQTSFGPNGTTPEKAKQMILKFIGPMIHENCRLSISSAKLLNSNSAVLLTLAVNKQNRTGGAALLVNLGDKSAVVDYQEWKNLGGTVYGILHDLPPIMPTEIKVMTWYLSQKSLVRSIIGDTSMIQGKRSPWEPYLTTKVEEWNKQNPAK